VGGTTEWCDGSFVYRDYVYDDYGAEQGIDSPHTPGLSKPKGDVDHRDHGQSPNSADLLALRLEARGNNLRVRFELNTLFPEDATVAALAIDSDGDPATGRGGPWGVVDVASDGWDRVHLLDDRDPNANVIAGRVPLPSSPGGAFRVQAVLALGDGTPMNVAFRPGDRGNWWEAEQADALAAGDVSAFGASVSLDDLGAGVHRPAGPPGPGYYEQVYRSKYPIAEGVDYHGVPGPTPARFHYLGTHQPYALYVPPGPAPHGAQLLLHGASVNHAAQINQRGAQRVLGDGQNRILVSPLGRGPSNTWVDWGARDALDALADVEANHAVDEDAVFVSGYSMGGGGTLQLATSFPDRFAGGIDWVGFSGDCFNGTPLAQGRQNGTQAAEPVDPYFSNSPEEQESATSPATHGGRSGCPNGTRGNALDFLDNTRHVPIAHLFTAADELVWANHALAVGRRMEELGYEHRLWLHAGEHFTLILFDDWRKEAAWSSGRRLTRRPARVTYRTNTFLWVPELDLVPDGAYWVDELRPRNASPKPEGDMVADLTSHACPSGHQQEVAIKRDAGTDPVPWIGQEGVVTGHRTSEPGNRISGTLTNVDTVLIDLDQACLAAGAAVDLDIRTDGPTLIRFSDGRPPVHLGPPSGP
jgi:dienelactone hydrolase